MTEKVCGKPAAFDYIWSASQSGRACIDCAEKLQGLAKFMGHHVNLISVETGTCTQIRSTRETDDATT